jgi:hypothetical protein
LCPEYSVVKGPKPWEAKILSGERDVAEISKQDDLSFKLTKQDDGREWILTNKVDGERRPFSLAVFETSKPDGQMKEVLKIWHHLFKHDGKFYMFGNHPEGKHWQEYLDSTRYISRLDKFPYSDVTEVSRHNTHRVKRFMRGVAVGETEGLGIHGHKVRVDNELEDIGLILAASSYLMYATA